MHDGWPYMRGSHLRSRRDQLCLCRAVWHWIRSLPSQRSLQYNAAIIALAKAFAEQGIKDEVQVNSIVPGPVMTGRRRSFMEKWAPAHNMSVEEATKQFPERVGISRYGEPKEIATCSHSWCRPSEMDDWHVCTDGRRRNQGYLALLAGCRRNLRSKKEKRT